MRDNYNIRRRQRQKDPRDHQREKTNDHRKLLTDLAVVFLFKGQNDCEWEFEEGLDVELEEVAKEQFFLKLASDLLESPIIWAEQYKLEKKPTEDLRQIEEENDSESVQNHYWIEGLVVNVHDLRVNSLIYCFMLIEIKDLPWKFFVESFPVHVRFHNVKTNERNQDADQKHHIARKQYVDDGQVDDHLQRPHHYEHEPHRQPAIAEQKECNWEHKHNIEQDLHILCGVL